MVAARKCKVCGRPRGRSSGHGMCDMHYARWRRNGEPGPAEQLIIPGRKSPRNPRKAKEASIRYRRSTRECDLCGKAFRGEDHPRCSQCRTTDRTCSECGRSFRHHSNTKCSGCRATIRRCAICGESFRGRSLRCLPCRTPDRQCADCGRSFSGTKIRCASCARATLPADTRSANERRRANARRARKRAAEVSGPLPLDIYIRIIASGSCVYCGKAATTIDHVCPLARGGHEIETNLVPACGHCNSSKCDRLLTEWRPDRVAHAVAVSPLVAAEYERQLTEATEAKAA
jgi:hypothetical protein